MLYVPRLFDLTQAHTDVGLHGLVSGQTYLQGALGLMPGSVHLFSSGITTVRIFQGFHSHCQKKKVKIKGHWNFTRQWAID